MQRSALAVLMLYGCAAADAKPRSEVRAPEADGGFTQQPARADSGLPDRGEAETDAAPDAAPLRTTIRVHYAGHAGALAIRGSAGALSWDHDVALTAVGNDLAA